MSAPDPAEIHPGGAPAHESRGSETASIHMSHRKLPLVNSLQEFSVPLIAGVLVALTWANVHHASYEGFLHWVPSALHDVHLFHHGLFYFLVNDIFMVFFFGIAAKEITDAAAAGRLS